MSRLVVEGKLVSHCGQLYCSALCILLILDELSIGTLLLLFELYERTLFFLKELCVGKTISSISLLAIKPHVWFFITFVYENFWGHLEHVKKNVPL